MYDTGRLCERSLCASLRPSVQSGDATSNLSHPSDQSLLFRRTLGGFASFFTKSSKRTAVLDEMVAHRLPSASSTRWSFNSGAVNTVYEHKDDLVRGFLTICNSEGFHAPTKRETGGFVRRLEDEAFCFFLALFHKIMPHVDMLYNQLQKRNIDSVTTAGIT